MAKGVKLLGFIISTIDENGNIVRIHDQSNMNNTIDNPYHNTEACEALNKKISERISRKASEMYNNNPDIFPDEVFVKE